MYRWDQRFLDLASLVSSWSKDRTTSVGCVLVGDRNNVIALGYNGFPRGIDDEVEERHERPAKYMWTEHAERNAVYNASRNGLSVNGATAYVTLFPCMACSRAFVQSGVSRVVVEDKPDFNNEKWGPEWRSSLELLAEAGIQVDFL